MSQANDQLSAHMQATACAHRRKPILCCVNNTPGGMFVKNQTVAPSTGVSEHTGAKSLCVRDGFLFKVLSRRRLMML